MALSFFGLSVDVRCGWAAYTLLCARCWAVRRRWAPARSGRAGASPAPDGLSCYAASADTFLAAGLARRRWAPAWSGRAGALSALGAALHCAWWLPMLGWRWVVARARRRGPARRRLLGSAGLARYRRCTRRFVARDGCRYWRWYIVAGRSSRQCADRRRRWCLCSLRAGACLVRPRWRAIGAGHGASLRVTAAGAGFVIRLRGSTVAPVRAGACLVWLRWRFIGTGA